MPVQAFYDHLDAMIEQAYLQGVSASIPGIVQRPWNLPPLRPGVEMDIQDPAFFAALCDRHYLNDMAIQAYQTGNGPNAGRLGTVMACAKLGTLVKTSRGFQKIEYLAPGDRVLTHKGRLRTVLDTMGGFRDEFVKIAVAGYGRQILEFTPDHKFFVARWASVPVHPSQARSADPTGFSSEFRKKHREHIHELASWVPCGELRFGDLLLMPIYRGAGKTIDREYARILGYYLAEGSITGRLPQFSCHRDDVLVTEMPTLTSARVACYTNKVSQLARSVVISDKRLGDDLSVQVGRGVRNKVIPACIYEADPASKLEFMSAWFNGDGWQDDRGLHWSTCSRSLSLELQMLLASVDIPATVSRNLHTGDVPTGPRKGVGVEYVVTITNQFSGGFSGKSKAQHLPHRSHPRVFITGDYLAVPVQSIEYTQEHCEIRDITVEEDESFTAYGLAVHNCKKAMDYQAAYERALHARHASSVRCRVWAMARRTGHGSKTYGVFGVVRNELDQIRDAATAAPNTPTSFSADGTVQ